MKKANAFLLGAFERIKYVYVAFEIFLSLFKTYFETLTVWNDFIIQHFFQSLRTIFKHHYAH